MGLFGTIEECGEYVNVRLLSNSFTHILISSEVYVLLSLRNKYLPLKKTGHKIVL